MDLIKMISAYQIMVKVYNQVVKNEGKNTDFSVFFLKRYCQA